MVLFEVNQQKSKVSLIRLVRQTLPII